MYQVDSEDANFLFLERTDSPTHISLFALYEQDPGSPEVIRFQHVLQLIEKRLANTPVFRRKIKRLPADIDYPYWVDDELFDLDYHVRHLALPKPGDWRQFCIQISRLHSRPLDLTRPLWELYVIEGLDKIAGLEHHGFALYLKIHHAAMDEFTAIELLESLHQTIPNPHQHEETAQPIAYLPAPAPGLAQMLAQAAVNNSLRSVGMVRQSIRNYRMVSRFIARLGVQMFGKFIEGQAESSPANSRFGGQLSTARVFQGAFFERHTFDELVAEVPGASLSHVLMLICGEALRLYLQQHNEASQDSLTGLRQINLRNAGAHALVGNRIAIEQLDLFTNIPNLIDRLYAIVGSLRTLDDEDDIESRGFKLHALYDNVPAPLLAILGRISNRDSSPSRQIMQTGHFGFAELRGPKVPLYLLGAKLYTFASISPLYSGCGLMFSASTYCDRIGLTFTSDRTMLPAPELMRDFLISALETAQSQLQSSPRQANRRMSSTLPFPLPDTPQTERRKAKPKVV